VVEPKRERKRRNGFRGKEWVKSLRGEKKKHSKQKEKKNALP